MQNETLTTQQDKPIASGQPHYSTMLKQIIINAEKNLGKQSKGRRHPDVLKKFCIALFIYTGPLAYEFLHQKPCHVSGPFRQLFIQSTKQLMKVNFDLMTL